MSAERMKVLQMLSEGKVTVDEADKLLRALGLTGEQGKDNDKAQKRPWDGLSDTIVEDMDNLEEEVKERIGQARDTIRASMPRVKQTINEVMPDIDHIVKEATASIPDKVENITRNFPQNFADWPAKMEHITRNLSQAFGQWSDEARYPQKVNRCFAENTPLAAGSRLVLHNAQGHIEVETWEQEELSFEATLIVNAKNQAAAQTYANTVHIDLERHPEALYIKPEVPEKENATSIGSYRLDFHLKVPHKTDIDLYTTHGNLNLPALAGNVVVGVQHGKTTIGSVGKNLSIHQSHGSAMIDQVGERLVLESQHSSIEVGTIADTATIKLEHGPIVIGHIGEDAEISQNHGALEIASIGGNALIKTNHGPACLNKVQGSLKLEGDHSRVEVVGVSGEVIAKNGHGSISLAEVTGDVKIESSRSAVDLMDIDGAIVVRSERAPVCITRCHSGVTVQNTRSNITVRPDTMVQEPYTLHNERGNIDIDLPSEANIEVQGYITRGRVHTNLPLAVDANNQQGQTVSGRLGTGEVLLKVEVDKGDLMLNNTEKMHSEETAS